MRSCEIASSRGRLGNAEPASIIGAVIDLAAAMSQAAGPHMSRSITATIAPAGSANASARAL
jgi:hypothetical protein